MGDNALLMFSKSPVSGQVKTRIAAHLGADLAADLQRAFIIDLGRRFALNASASPIELIANCAPDDEHPVFQELAKLGWTLWLQDGDDLGARLRRSIRRAFKQGVERLVIIGSDSPTLPTCLVDDAFAALQSVDVVVGPAFDGGYYLIGVSRELSAPFEGIKWSEGTVFSETIARLEERNISYFVLPFWNDVDELADLRLIKSNIGLRGPYGRIDAPATGTLLARITLESKK